MGGKEEGKEGGGERGTDVNLFCVENEGDESK